MGIGREVADAYISVHGDMKPFRKDLEKAQSAMQKAFDKLDPFENMLGAKAEDRLKKQWASLVDTVFTGDPISFDRMFGAFDSKDLDAASEKIHNLVGEMQGLGKISGESADQMLKDIDREIKARQGAQFALRDQRNAEEQLAKDRTLWANAQEAMMKGLKAARQKDADHAKALLENATREEKAAAAERRKVMEEAIALNQKYDRSMQGMIRNIKAANLEDDFKKIGKAMATANWTDFVKAHDFGDLRNRVNEVTNAMMEQGRVTRENAFQMSAGINDYIDGVEREQKAIQDALDATNAAREAADKYKASLAGMRDAANARALEDDFRRIAVAMDSNNWDSIARGHTNMRDLRNRTTEVLGAMHALGRVSTDEMATIFTSMRSANIEFTRATPNINRMAGAFGRARTVLTGLWSVSKGFREHLGGFAGINVFGDMIREGLDFIHNLDRIALSASLTTTKLASMASIGGSALSSLVTVLGDIGATLGGLSAVAPAFLIGGGIGIAALVVSLKDMKTVLKDLAPAFAKLQDNISAKFWAQAAGPIRSVVNGLMPLLNAKLGATGTALGGVFAALANGIKNVPQNMIGDMFDRMNSAITILQGAMSPLVSAFATLGDAGSQFFERTATSLVDLSNRFNNFIQAAAADGRLIGWIDTMIEGFKNMGRALDGIFGIFNALDSAATAAGFGGLKTFADNLQRMAAGMQSAGAQTALTQLLSGMLILTTKVGEALYKLGDPLASIMPTVNLALSAVGDAVSTIIGYIGQILANPVVQQGITDFTNGIKAAVDALAPAIEPFAQSLGTMMSLLGQIIVNVANIATAFTVVLGPVLDQISKQFETLVQPLGDAVVAVITALGPVAQAINDNLVGPIVSGIRDFILPGFVSMIETLAPIAAQMVAALGPVLQALLPLIPPIMELATTIGGLLMQAVIAVAPVFTVLIGALMPVVDAIVQLVNMVAPYLIPAIQQIATAVTPVIEVLGQVVGFILSVLVPILGVLLIGIINNVVGVFQGLSNFIMGFVQIVTAIFTGFGQFFTKLFQGDIGGALTALGTMFGDIWNGIVQMLSGALEFLWNAVQLIFVGKLIGGIKTALTSIASFFSSTWSGIGGTVSGALNTLVSVINGGLATAKSFVSNALSAMINFFTSGWSNMVSATTTGIGNVMSWVGGIPGKISGALSGLGGLLVNAGRAIIDGLLAGLKAAWGAVTSFVGGIASWIADHKGPLPYDRRLLIPAGQAIMDGLGGGLMSKLGMLQGVLTTVTDTMTNHVTDAFGKSKMFIAGADAALGLADGLKSNKGTIANALEAVMPGSPTAVVGVSGSSLQGVGSPTPQKIVTFEKGAFELTTPTKDPGIVAAKVIDEFANLSNL